MLTQKLFKRSLDFWIIIFICLSSLLYIIYSEIFPNDWILSKKSYHHHEAYQIAQNWTRYAIASKERCHFDIAPYVNNPELLFKNVIHDYLGNHHNTKVILANIEGKRFIVKKYKCPDFFAWIKWIPLRSSKAFRNWHFSCKLTDLNIPTAKPILMIEKKIGPFWTSTYLIREFIDGLTCYEFFSKNSPHKKDWPHTLHELKNYLNELDKHQLIHGKISLHNTLIYGNKPYFLDLDLMHQYRLNHQFYKKRVENQHLLRLRRKFAETDLEAQNLYLRYFEEITLYE